jgi:hypothetical protein
MEKTYKFTGDDSTQLCIQMEKTQQTALLANLKTVTRRAWKSTWINAHMRAFAAHTLVAVVGQGHTTTLGYIRYVNIVESTAGVILTKDDLEKEGCPQWTDAKFRAKWYIHPKSKAPINTSVHSHIRILLHPVSMYNCTYYCIDYNIFLLLL